ncbi:hypothetical protein ABPG74_010319 [Tetrahymena malaccensis]
MASVVTYYLVMCLFFICIAIYNAIFYSTYSADKCQIQTISDPSTTGGASTTTTKTSSIQLAVIPIVITIMYSIIIFLTLMGLLCIRKFEAMDPDRFRKLGCCLGTCGLYVRNLKLLINFLHWVIALVIIIQFIFIFGTSDCTKAVHYSLDYPQGQIGKMYDDSKILNYATGGCWFFFHFICPCFKKCIHEQAYIYEPLDSDKSILKLIFCDIFGP